MTDPLLRNTPPHHFDAERAVLGAILCRDAGTGVLDLLADSLKPSHFYSAKHAAGYEAMLGLWAKGQPVDELTLADELQRRGVEQAHAEVAEWLDSVPSPANAEYYAARVVDASVRRETLLRAAKIQDAAYAWTGTREEWVAFAEATLHEATAQGIASNEATASEVCSDLRTHMAAIRDGSLPTQHVRTGFRALDHKARIVPQNLVVIAGRPSMGKSSLAINMLCHLSMAGTPCVMFSLEMQKFDVLMNMACFLGGVNGVAIRDGEATQAEWGKFFASLGQVHAQADFLIDDTPALNPVQFRAKVRRLVRSHGIKVAFIDYLQLMTGSRPSGHEHRHLEVAEISRSVKAVARELGIVVFALSQLNRKAEDRSNKTPQLADLRESGAIEQDLDVCLLVHRPEYYDRENEDLKGKASVIVAKNRNGATGEVAFRFEGRCFRFLEDEEANNRRDG